MFPLRAILATLVCTGLTAGAPHRYKVHPNANLNIEAIAESRDGFLWLAATDGLYQFDGLRYRKIPGYPLPSARFLATTPDGALWVAGLDGLVRYQDRFRIIHRSKVFDLTIAKGKLYATQEIGDRKQLVRIEPGGAVVPLDHRANPGSIAASDRDGKLWFFCHSGGKLCSFDPDDPASFQERNVSGELPGYKSVALDSTGGVWLANDTTAIPLEDQASLEFHREPQTMQRSGPLLQGRGGKLWFLGETISEISSSAVFVNRKQAAMFPPTAGFEDTSGRLWIACYGLGLVEWTSDPQWERWFQEDFPRASPAEVFDVAAQRVLIAHGGLFRFDPARRAWIPSGSANLHHDAALALADGSFLATAREWGVIRLDSSGRILEKLPGISFPWPGKAEKNRLRTLPAPSNYRALARDGQGRIWAGNKYGLVEVQGKTGSFRLRIEPLPKVQIQTEAVALDVDQDGVLWVGYEAGLAWRDVQSQWHPLEIAPPVRNIRSFALAGSTIWVAVRDQNRFFKLTRSGDGWRSEALEPDKGFGPRDTLFLKRDSRGWIWRGATGGVLVADGTHFKPEDWLRLDANNGLTSGTPDINGFFEDSDHSIWISGGSGVAHFHPDSSWFGANASPLVISNITTPNAGLRAEISAMRLNPFRSYPVRFRLRGFSREWSYSQDGVVQYASLPRGRYALEVAESADDASVVSLPIQIGSRFSYIWLLGFAPLALLPFALRGWRGPEWLQRIRYRFRKLRFMTRRRIETGRSSPDLAGRVLLDRFAVEHVVAHGGFSTIYQATDRVTGAVVAIKRLRREVAKNGRMRDRFIKEVAALRSIQHANVVPVIESWIDDSGDACLAMPFLEGPTLREELRIAPFHPDRAARVVRSIGSALGEMHARGVIHRDLKPENIMLIRDTQGDETPILIDFGIAGIREETGLTATKTLAGSIPYMAPEGLTGHYSSASDIYSLGVITLEMLTLATIGDFESAIADPRFLEELRAKLLPPLGQDRAVEIAGLLVRSFDPYPARRPGAREWTRHIALLLGRVPG